MQGNLKAIILNLVLDHAEFVELNGLEKQTIQPDTLIDIKKAQSYAVIFVAIAIEPILSKLFTC